MKLKEIADKLIALRKEWRRLFWGVFRPKIIECENSRAELNEQLKQHWQPDQINVYELIREEWEKDSKENFIVFIDHDLDIDWINLSSGTACEKAISAAESVGARRCKHLPREQLLELKRLIGQAIVCAIQGESDQALSLTDDAAQFLKDRTVERSRCWTLSYAHVICVLFSALILKIYQIVSICHTNDFSMLLVAAEGGIIGAYISTIQRAGKGEWDAAAGRGMHLLEVFTKISAGALFGALAFVLTKSVNSPASLKQIAPDKSSALVLGVVAGFVERLIPRMISKYSEFAK